MHILKKNYLKKKIRDVFGDNTRRWLTYRRIRFLNTILDCGGCEGWTPAEASTMSVISVIAAVEAVDQASDTDDPATDALEEQGESKPLPRMLVLPLTERLLVGAIKKIKKKFRYKFRWNLKMSKPKNLVKLKKNQFP